MCEYEKYAPFTDAIRRPTLSKIARVRPRRHLVLWGDTMQIHYHQVAYNIVDFITYAPLTDTLSNLVGTPMLSGD